MLKSCVILILYLFFANFTHAEEFEIKRSVQGDKGKYYLLKVEKMEIYLRLYINE